MKNTIGVLLLLLSVVLVAWSITAEILADNEYNRQIGSYWSLSEKSSTLDLKANYLDQFVSAVEHAELSGNNALVLKTPDNNFEQNMNALHSLQVRMHVIRGMDVQSFQYQQAISQITAQEQGEASQMLDVISGVWLLKYHTSLWGWIDGLKWLALVCMVIVGIIGICSKDY